MVDVRFSRDPKDFPNTMKAAENFAAGVEYHKERQAIEQQVMHQLREEYRSKFGKPTKVAETIIKMACPRVIAGETATWRERNGFKELVFSKEDEG